MVRRYIQWRGDIYSGEEIYTVVRRYEVVWQRQYLMSEAAEQDIQYSCHKKVNHISELMLFSYVGLLLQSKPL